MYYVLSDFAKCADSCEVSALQVPKIEEGGGVQTIRARPVFRLFFMAFLRQLTETLWTGYSPILGSHTSLG